MADCRAHSPEVEGSSPSPATKVTIRCTGILVIHQRVGKGEFNRVQELFRKSHLCITRCQDLEAAAGY